MQLDRSLGVLVGHGEDLVADAARDRQFLAQLAFQAGDERFAGCAFAAGKFPVAFEMDAARPPGDQKSPVLLDHGGGYDDRFRHAHSFAIGHTRHFGSRATQTVAPKSINA